MTKNTIKLHHVFEAFLGGAVVGTIATLFLTPRSGPEVRGLVKGYVEQGTQMAGDFAGRVPKMFRKGNSTTGEEPSSRRLSKSSATI